MIISVSRRTDIPAFYSEWFINRVNEGFFVRVNPMNRKQQKVFSLSPTKVDCFVFWSKNPLPLIKHLDILDEKGYYYYFQFTLNDYPQIFEPRLPELDTRVETFKKLSSQIGPSKVIWRYDPIILSNLTTIDYHIEHFDKLSSNLKGSTQRVMISFLDMYGKVNSKLKKFEKDYNLKVEDITKHKDKLNYLINKFSSIAYKNDFELHTCAENIDLEKYGAKHGRCIDPELIEKLTQKPLNVKKDPSQRPECLCAESVDMGFYNTCKYNCSYCYANISDKAVFNNYNKHHPNSPVMIGECNITITDEYVQQKIY